VPVVEIGLDLADCILKREDADEALLARGFILIGECEAGAKAVAEDTIARRERTCSETFMMK